MKKAPQKRITKYDPPKQNFHEVHIRKFYNLISFSEKNGVSNGLNSFCHTTNKQKLKHFRQKNN